MFQEGSGTLKPNDDDDNDDDDDSFSNYSASRKRTKQNHSMKLLSQPTLDCISTRKTSITRHELEIKTF